MSSKVYFSESITPESIKALFEKLNFELNGNVAVKVHSGEKGNQNFLRPTLWNDIISHVNGTVVECNTAYPGERDTTEKHRHLMSEHEWDKYFPVDLLDADCDDVVIDIPDGKRIKRDYVGGHIANYDSMLVLSHFKGHPMGGYGGALKQLSIGLASSYGKANIHGAGDASKLWTQEQDLFLESMADAAHGVIGYFKGNIAYINVMKNMSVDCDCCAIAEDPCMGDIGVLASLDPVAIDKACIDLVEGSNDKGKEHLLERIKSRHGTHTIEAAEALGCGTTDYELIKL